jgi:TfoX/Sxy family transcriptional regulator of competence genes
MANEALNARRALIEQTAAALPPDNDLEFRHMFGGMGAYARGRIFAILGGSRPIVALKLPEDAREELLSEPGAVLFQPAPDSSVMKQYVEVPEHLCTPEGLRPWMARSIEYVKTLPLKKKR